MLRPGQRCAAPAPEILHLMRQPKIGADHREALISIFTGKPVCFHDPLHRPVGGAENPDLSLPLKTVHGLDHSLDRNLHIIPVQQINIDMVCLQFRQGIMQITLHVKGRHPVPVAVRMGAFCHDHCLLSALSCRQVCPELCLAVNCGAVISIQSHFPQFVQQAEPRLFFPPHSIILCDLRNDRMGHADDNRRQRLFHSFYTSSLHDTSLPERSAPAGSPTKRAAPFFSRPPARSAFLTRILRLPDFPDHFH